MWIQIQQMQQYADIYLLQSYLAILEPYVTI